MENSRETQQSERVVANRYVLEKKLGSGEIGPLFLANDRKNNSQPVVLRLVHSRHVPDPDSGDHYIRQVDALRDANHENLVKFLDAGWEGKTVFYTMQPIKGKSLERILDKSAADDPFTVDHVIIMAEEIAAGLAALHEHGVLHLDLNLKNIFLLKDYKIKLSGFGPDQPTDFYIHEREVALPSHRFLAPEVWYGQSLTPAVDLYAFGVVLYVLATSEFPLQAQYVKEMREMHLKTRPRSPRSLNERIPPWLDLIISNLLSKDPQKRPKSAEHVLRFFEANRTNGTQFTRLPELAGQLEIFDGPGEHTKPSAPASPSEVYFTADTQAPTNIMSGTNRTTVQFSIPKPEKAKKQISSKRKMQVLAAAGVGFLALAGVLLSSSDTCACTTVRDVFKSSLGIGANEKLNSVTLKPYLEKFIPKGTIRNAAEKRLSALAGEHQNWCGSLGKSEYRCTFSLNTGILQSESLQIGLLFDSKDGTQLTDTRIKLTTSWLGSTSEK